MGKSYKRYLISRFVYWALGTATLHQSHDSKTPSTLYHTPDKYPEWLPSCPVGPLSSHVGFLWTAREFPRAGMHKSEPVTWFSSCRRSDPLLADDFYTTRFNAIYTIRLRICLCLQMRSELPSQNMLVVLPNPNMRIVLRNQRETQRRCTVSSSGLFSSVYASVRSWCPWISSLSQQYYYHPPSCPRKSDHLTPWIGHSIHHVRL